MLPKKGFMLKKGWRPDVPDLRDFWYRVSRQEILKRPTSIDLRPKMPVIYNQRSLGSCTAQSVAGVVEYLLRKTGKKEHQFIPSRLFIYYNERVIEGTVGWDSGATIRDSIKTVNKQGICREITWPYIVNKFINKPPSKAYKEALLHKALRYERVPQTAEMIETRLSQQFPITLGISVYESFETDEVATTGRVPMPSQAENLLGGHAVCLCGYDSIKKIFIARNSWGKDWGQNGYFIISYNYILNNNLCDDIWTVTLVS